MGPRRWSTSPVPMLRSPTATRVSRPAAPAARADRRPRRSALTALREEVVRIGELELSLLRPDVPEDLIDEATFADDEFLPYWAELWPAARALAAALPEVDGLRVVEL